MTLTDPADILHIRVAQAKWRSKAGSNQNGVFTHAVYMGEGEAFHHLETIGYEEFLIFEVFLHNIRRESQGIADASGDHQLQWYEMAKQFIVEFGENRTPPDVRYECERAKQLLGL